MRWKPSGFSEKENWRTKPTKNDFWMPVSLQISSKVSLAASGSLCSSYSRVKLLIFLLRKWMKSYSDFDRRLLVVVLLEVLPSYVHLIQAHSPFNLVFHVFVFLSRASPSTDFLFLLCTQIGKQRHQAWFILFLAFLLLLAGGLFLDVLLLLSGRALILLFRHVVVFLAIDLLGPPLSVYGCLPVSLVLFKQVFYLETHSR